MAEPWTAEREQAYRKSVECAAGIYPPSEVMYTLADMQDALATLDAERARREQVEGSVKSYQNALKAVEEFLAPEWDVAQAEVLSESNAGWTMMARRAIQAIRARAEQAERERDARHYVCEAHVPLSEPGNHDDKCPCCEAVHQADLVVMLAEALKGVALNGSDETPLWSWCDEGWTCKHLECIKARDALAGDRGT